MIGLRRGAVTAVVERAEGLVRLEVDGEPCVAYPRLTGPVALGDEVLVNVQARELGLGSGGFDVLVANLTRGLGLPPEPGAHVMTLPYTPVQAAAQFAEETDELAESLDGMPVVLCTVHSQVAPVAAGLEGARVAYVQVAGGALPVSLSDAVRALKARGLVEVAVAAAPCLDGDVQCAGVAGALLWAARRYEAVIASVGPGLVGTGISVGPRGARPGRRRQRHPCARRRADPGGAHLRAGRARAPPRRLAPCPRRARAVVSDRARGRGRGLGGGMRGASALAHGPRA